ncbi:hypothetical protein PoB_006941400 [Plakobranchus ocellatus]|uniref:Uncharacterized protein n=1 Tax=Plakobranchus ocellatus TaxID=259542 RepID=A0AAV4DFF4_9GAST|nr:hypothetical protein PoB_006941400 [Plakobranchus ocellatus]
MDVLIDVRASMLAVISGTWCVQHQIGLRQPKKHGHINSIYSSAGSILASAISTVVKIRSQPRTSFYSSGRDILVDGETQLWAERARLAHVGVIVM